MGLPLYQAPVDSDIAPRPSADSKNPAYARSAIRRTRVLRSNDDIRDYRRRRLWAAFSNEDAPSADRRSAGALAGMRARLTAEREAREAHEVRVMATRDDLPDEDMHLSENPPASVSTTTGPGRSQPRAGDRLYHRAFRDLTNRFGSVDATRIISNFGDHWHTFVRLPRYASGGSAASSDAEDGADGSESPNFPERASNEANLPSRRLRALREVAADSYTVPNVRHDSERSDWRRYLHTALPGSARTPRRRRPVSGRTFEQEPPRAPRVDGLGDRNRSLSPEGDNVWDTLLSTLAPDPRAPSAGSSFASTSASAVASQSGPGGSSRTSLTSPGVALDDDVRSLADPPCESGRDENSDTEGDEEEDDDEGMLEDEDDEEVRAPHWSRWPPGSRAAAVGVPASVAGRTYADVVRNRRRTHRGNTTSSNNSNANRGGSNRNSNSNSNSNSGSGSRSGSGSQESRGSSDTGADDLLEIFDLSGGYQDMQRIVRNLASREEIPDEWWAEAGLSRNFFPRPGRESN